MSSDEEMKQRVREILTQTGAVAVGFARSEVTDENDRRRYGQWLGRGDNAGMEYMEKNNALRRDPAGLLEGCRTVISLAYSFAPETFRKPELGMLACYAYGRDYHKVVRKLLKPAVPALRAELGGEWRVCVDSAPVRERYWACKAGIAFRGDNGSVIVPGHGSMVFLCELLTTLPIVPDTPLEGDCGHCGTCLRACPGGAIRSDGTIDSRRCLSYLTIEHRGPVNDPESRKVLDSETGRHTVFGCDICLRVCPHNRDIPVTEITDFAPRHWIMELTSARLREMPPEELSRLVAGSCLSRRFSSKGS